jgi:hypothetical protein
MMCVILGLAFLALGILGITGWVPMFQSGSIYVSIGEIVLGALGFLVGIYARGDVVYSANKVMSSRQGKDIDQQRQDIDQQRQEIDQQRQEIDQQRKDIDQQKKEIVE